MEKINKKVSITFAFALALSIGFPCGILGIIFGAVNKITVLLVFGIIFTVAGFYGTPMLWIHYGELRHDRSLVYMIENENLYTVQSLAKQIGYDEKNVRDRIMRLIRQHVLTGYIFTDDALVLNTNERQEEKSAPAKVCVQCGARMLHDGKKYYCEYCGFTDAGK